MAHTINKVYEEWKVRNCYVAVGLTFFRSRCILWRSPPNGFHVWGWTRETRARKRLRKPYMTTGGIFGANFIGIVRKYWIIDATPMRCLTAFKTENPNARKKTKFSRRGHHFSFLPSPFHTIDSRATIKSHLGDSLVESWLAGKLIRSIRCDRHVRKHVDNEACNFVSNTGLLALRVCYTD